MGKISQYNPPKGKEAAPAGNSGQPEQAPVSPELSGAINFVRQSRLLSRLILGGSETPAPPPKPPVETSRETRSRKGATVPETPPTQKTVWESRDRKGKKGASVPVEQPQQPTPEVNAQGRLANKKLQPDILPPDDPLYAEVASRVKASESLELRPPLPSALFRKPGDLYGHLIGNTLQAPADLEPEEPEEETPIAPSSFDDGLYRIGSQRAIRGREKPITIKDVTAFQIALLKKGISVRMSNGWVIRADGKPYSDDEMEIIRQIIS